MNNKPNHSHAPAPPWKAAVNPRWAFLSFWAGSFLVAGSAVWCIPETNLHGWFGLTLNVCFVGLGLGLAGLGLRIAVENSPHVAQQHSPLVYVFSVCGGMAYAGCLLWCALICSPARLAWLAQGLLVGVWLVCPYCGGRLSLWMARLCGLLRVDESGRRSAHRLAASDTVAAALIAGFLSGLPTTQWRLVRGEEEFWGWGAAAAVAGQLVDSWGLVEAFRVPAIAIVQSGMSLLWAGVLCRLLPRRCTLIVGLGSAFLIYQLDMLAVRLILGEIPETLLPSQLVEHLLFGGLVGAVVGWRRRREVGVGATAAAHDTSPQWAVPRWVVATSFAVSVIGFLSTSTVYFHRKWHDALTGLMTPIYAVLCDLSSLVDIARSPSAWLAGLNEGTTSLPFSLLFGLLGLSGMVISLRQPRRLGWFVCAHICLLEFYWISMTTVDCILGWNAC
jgi:hypothetical protein